VIRARPPAIQEFLRSVPLFHELDDEELTQLLLVARRRPFAEGTQILTEGEKGGHLHVIHEGSVRISKVVPGLGQEALVILQQGDVFGEVEFFDGAPSSAHATAHTDCEVVSVSHAEMRELIRTHPMLTAKFFWAFGRTLASRLRDTNQRIASLLAMSRTL
jgi:CRP/FNR family transcriptional regulator, cyclic AMP receptor protein